MTAVSGNKGREEGRDCFFFFVNVINDTATLGYHFTVNSEILIVKKKNLLTV